MDNLTETYVTKPLDITPEILRNGLKITTYLSDILNDNDLSKMIKIMIPGKMDNHYCYLLNKIKGCEGPLNKKISGALVLSVNRIHCNDQAIILEWIKNNYSSYSFESVLSTIWLIKYLKSNMSCLTFSEILDTEFESKFYNEQFDIYQNKGCDRYLYEAPDYILDKFINWGNKQRLKNGDKYDFYEGQLYEKLIILKNKTDS